ncbi:hypothetical protein T439DRAFT_110734 [Meredithblackwellia eburnea MCA 4105]
MEAHLELCRDLIFKSFQKKVVLKNGQSVKEGSVATSVNTLVSSEVIKANHKASKSPCFLTGYSSLSVKGAHLIDAIRPRQRGAFEDEESFLHKGQQRRDLKTKLEKILSSELGLGLERGLDSSENIVPLVNWAHFPHDRYGSVAFVPSTETLVGLIKQVQLDNEVHAQRVPQFPPCRRLNL